MKGLILVLDRFLYFLDSKFSILTVKLPGRVEKTIKKNNNEKHQRPGEDNGNWSGIRRERWMSPIRFISFPAAQTFPFAHSNWQNEIPVRLSFLSTTPGNHSSTAPHSPPIPQSAASSWQGMKQKVCFVFVQRSPPAPEHPFNLRSLKSPQGRAHFNFPFCSHHHLSCLCSLSPSASLARPAYLNNSSEVQPSPRIIISISLPAYWLATHSRGVSQTSISFKRNFLDSSTLGVKQAPFKKRLWIIQIEWRERRQSLGGSVNPDDIGFS